MVLSENKAYTTLAGGEPGFDVLEFVDMKAAGRISPWQFP
jgi:hypothetical protein